jgi:tellurite resistance protein TerC
VRRFFRLEKVPHPIRKVVIGILGGFFLILGTVMVVTPGPAFVFIPLGVVLLATEFPWAERWSHKIHLVLHQAREKWHERKRRRAQTP